MFPNECRPYLAGVVGRSAQLKFLVRAGMLRLGRLESRKRRLSWLSHAPHSVVALRKTLRILCSRAVRCMQCRISCTAGWIPSPRVCLVS
jgi:hypothetical protein